MTVAKSHGFLLQKRPSRPTLAPVMHCRKFQGEICDKQDSQDPARLSQKSRFFATKKTLQTHTGSSHVLSQISRGNLRQKTGLTGSQDPASHKRDSLSQKSRFFATKKTLRTHTGSSHVLSQISRGNLRQKTGLTGSQDPASHKRDSLSQKSRFFATKKTLQTHTGSSHVLSQISRGNLRQKTGLTGSQDPASHKRDSLSQKSRFFATKKTLQTHTGSSHVLSQISRGNLRQKTGLTGSQDPASHKRDSLSQKSRFFATKKTLQGGTKLGEPVSQISRKQFATE